ncbi:hypothetical protein B566_EDAN018331 [Ephemera danica]|nr:hypothetical protein B566_EDAN018331 [Ephemera danica]
MASVGRLLPFDETSEDIEAYFERVDMFFSANNIVVPSQQVASLITVLGPHAYDELRTACHPELFKDKSIKDIKKILIERFKRPNLYLSERLRLANRKQQAGETVAQFAQALRRLARSCGYTGPTGAIQQGAALLESFVNNLRDIRVKKEVITKDNLNLKKAEEIASKYELVYEQLDKIEEVQGQGQNPVVAALSTLEESVCAISLNSCWRCGSKGHKPENCRARTWECFVCGNIGHIATMCRQRGDQGHMTSERQQASGGRKEWNERPLSQPQQSSGGVTHCSCCRHQRERPAARGGGEREHQDWEYGRGAPSGQRGGDHDTKMSKGSVNKKCMCLENDCDEDAKSDSSGRTREEARDRLFQVLRRLAEFGVKINLEKCQFMQQKVQYVGHILSEQGILPPQSRFDAISKTEPPTTKALMPFDSKLPIVICTDASPVGTAAVLYHVDETGKERPVFFTSKSLTPTQQKYPQIEKEGLAIIHAVQKFHKFVYGKEFTLVSDNKPIVYIFAENKQIPVTAHQRIQRWALMLSAYKYQLKHRKGVELLLPDYLSRTPLPDTDEGTDKHCSFIHSKLRQLIPLNYTHIACETKSDPTLVKVAEYVQKGWPYTLSETTLAPYFTRSTHGFCRTLGSDNGPPFTAAQFAEYCEKRGIIHVLTPPWHPKSNGSAEKAVQTFKKFLKKLSTEYSGTLTQSEIAAGTVTLRPRVELGSPTQAFGTPEKLRTDDVMVNPVPEPAHSPAELEIEEERTTSPVTPPDITSIQQRTLQDQETLNPTRARTIPLRRSSRESQL